MKSWTRLSDFTFFSLSFSFINIYLDYYSLLSVMYKAVVNIIVQSFEKHTTSPGYLAKNKTVGIYAKCMLTLC